MNKNVAAGGAEAQMSLIIKGKICTQICFYFDVFNAASQNATKLLNYFTKNKTQNFIFFLQYLQMATWTHTVCNHGM